MEPSLYSLFLSPRFSICRSRLILDFLTSVLSVAAIARKRTQAVSVARGAKDEIDYHFSLILVCGRPLYRLDRKSSLLDLLRRELLRSRKEGAGDGESIVRFECYCSGY